MSAIMVIWLWWPGNFLAWVCKKWLTQTLLSWPNLTDPAACLHLRDWSSFGHFCHLEIQVYVSSCCLEPHLNEQNRKDTHFEFLSSNKTFLSVMLWFLLYLEKVICHVSQRMLQYLTHCLFQTLPFSWWVSLHWTIFEILLVRKTAKILKQMSKIIFSTWNH